jgi:hypothetical protein
MAISFTAAANNCTIATVTSITCTLPVAVAAGDIVLVIANCGATTAPTSVTITDGSGDTYTDSALGSFVGGGTFNTGRFRVGAFLTPTVGTTTFTATMSPANGNFAEIYAWKVSGIVGTPTLDKAVQANGTGTTADSGSSGTLTAAAEAAVGYVTVANAVTGAGSGWSTGGTNINDGIQTTSSDIGEHRITAATTAIDATCAISSGGDWLAILLTAFDAGSTFANNAIMVMM